MNRAQLLSLLIILLVLAGLATLNGGLLAMALPLVVYLAASQFFAPAEIQLQVSRSINPRRAIRDATVKVELEIINQGAHQEEVFIEDQLPSHLELVEGETSVLVELPVNASTKLEYVFRGGRGVFNFQYLRVTAHDRLGLAQRRKKILTPGQTLILPDAPRLKRVAIRPRQTRVYAGNVPAHLGGPGIEFFGVREYQVGDTPGQINWQASARHPHLLYSNEFEQERVADVGLILDSRQRLDIQTPSGSLFEHQVSAASALAETLLNDGNRVGLLIYGNYLDWTHPGYGKLQRERILHALASARTGSSLISDELENLPARIFPPRSQLILISPLINEDLYFVIRLRATGYPILIISPDPIAFQERRLPENQTTLLAARLARLERNLLLTRLRHAGVHLVEWDVNTPFDLAMHRVLSHIPAGLRFRRVTT